MKKGEEMEGGGEIGIRNLKNKAFSFSPREID